MSQQTVMLPEEVDVVDLTFPSLKKFYAISKQDRIVAGYASVAVPDKVGDEFPSETLRKALDDIMKREGGRWRNIMYGHQSVQIGEIIEQYKDSKSKIWKTQVDDVGLFIVARITSSKHLIANKVWELILEGELNSFSIMGVALDWKFVKNGRTKRVITELELYETTICQSGMNPYAKFQVVKSMKLSECLPKFKKIIILPNCIQAVGSAVKFGKGNDFDIWLDPKLKEPLINNIAKEIQKLFPKSQWDKLDQFADPSGPDGPAIPIMNLVLEPTLHGHMQEEGVKRPSALTNKKLEEKKTLSEQIEDAPIEEKENTGLEESEKNEVEEQKEKKQDEEPELKTVLSEILGKLNELIEAWKPRKPDGEKYPYGDKYPKPKDEEEKADKPEDEEEEEDEDEKAKQIDKRCSSRRGGKPRTDQERETRHKRKHPGTKLPPRGTGLNRAEKPDEEEDEEEEKKEEPKLSKDDIEKMITKKAEEKLAELLKANPPEKKTKQPDKGEVVKKNPVKELLDMPEEDLHKVSWDEIHRIVKGEE